MALWSSTTRRLTERVSLWYLRIGTQRHLITAMMLAYTQATIHYSSLSSTGRSDTDVTFTDDEELDFSGAEDCDHTSGTWLTVFCTMLFTLLRTATGYFRKNWHDFGLIWLSLCTWAMTITST